MNKKLVSLVAAVFMFATNAGAVDFSGKTVEWLIPCANVVKSSSRKSKCCCK